MTKQHKPISERQELFCLEYVKDFNAAQAMMRAGYAEKTARHGSTALLRQPHIQAKLKELTAQVRERALLSAEMVLRELGNIAQANLADYYKWSDTKGKYVLKALSELTEEQQRCIAKYRPGEYIELHSKDGALDKLAKHFKLYQELEASTFNFVMMGDVRIGGKSLEFKIGRPAPKADAQKALLAKKN